MFNPLKLQSFSLKIFVMLYASNGMLYANNGSCQICTNVTFPFDNVKDIFEVTDLRNVSFIVSER